MRGQEPWSEITQGTQEKFKGALEALTLNLTQIKALAGIDMVHTHTWYVSMAGFLAKKLYDIPFVLTTHSLEPLRAWKAEQLGSRLRDEFVDGAPRFWTRTRSSPSPAARRTTSARLPGGSRSGST